MTSKKTTIYKKHCDKTAKLRTRFKIFMECNM